MAARKPGRMRKLTSDFSSRLLDLQARLDTLPTSIQQPAFSLHSLHKSVLIRVGLRYGQHHRARRSTTAAKWRLCHGRVHSPGSSDSQYDSSGEACQCWVRRVEERGKFTSNLSVVACARRASDVLHPADPPVSRERWQTWPHQFAERNVSLQS